MYCHDPGVMSSNPGWVELGVLGTSVLSRTGIKIYNYLQNNIIQLYSGITCGRVLNGEFYAQGFQKLMYLHLYLFTDFIS